MKNRIPQAFFLIVLIIMIGIICIYGIVTGSNTDFGNNSEVRNLYSEFNRQQKQYIKGHSTIKVYVDPNLRYLMNDDGTGYLWDYMRSVLKPAGISFDFTNDSTEADCYLMVIDDKLREKSSAADYTAPLFQVEGTVFAKENKDDIAGFNGVIMDGRIDDGDIKRIKYDGSTIDFTEADTAEEAVRTALEEDLDFIAGDRAAITNALNGNSKYIAEEESLYSSNACILVSKEATALCEILNDCLYAADRNGITYRAGQKWFSGNAPRYMRDSYEDMYMLVLIIFTAIMIAFFIYYQANKNLYHELNDRMEKLTESKRELKTTFNGVGYYLAEIDLEGNILDINRAFYNFVSTDTANRKVWDVLDLEPKYVERIQQMLEDTDDGKNTHTVEIRLKKQTLDIDIFPIENGRGSIEKLLFMAMDVTRERMAERQLLQDNKMIAVGQLAAGVAHEIRNPLGIIRNYCYVLKNMSDENVKAKAIEQIEKSVDNSSAIINSLLNFSRISTKHGETVDIEDHIWSLIQLNNNILKKKKIDLEINCEDNVVTFLAVESLDMILINLISNATDAMSDNGSLRINVFKYADSFEIDVEDTGTGIEEDILQDIFNPFFTTKGNKKGNGLGLYIVYNEVNKLNGTIEVESKPGEGSKFRLTLPLIEADAGKEEKNDQRES
ncbi:MAG: ATP-binding protein [Firmicutes bacterium]|nr:ATP-binding protein [Bacillota bacterium]